MRFDDSDFKKYNGEYTYGRIKFYDNRKGFGFIYLENNKDVLLSSRSMTKATERKMMIGAIVKCKIVPFDKGYAATDIVMIDKYPNGYELTLPNGENLKYKHIRKIGTTSATINNKSRLSYVYLQELNGWEEIFYNTEVHPDEKNAYDEKTLRNFLDTVFQMHLQND